ncbi:hypothetical protein D3C86_1562860 [compost metagenome]
MVWDRGDLVGDVGHVEGTGHAIDQADSNQKEQRRRQVDCDITQSGPHPLLARPMQQQAVGGGQHDLEEDEQVEQVAGQNRPVHAHDQ